MRSTALFVVLAAAVPAAQAPAAAPASPAVLLGRGWTAIGAGRPADAVRIAGELLAASPRDHRAMTLELEALSVGDPGRALDAYERWLAQVHVEDLFLLEPIARGTLEQIAAGRDTGLKIDALERLARAGVHTARTRLNEGRTTANAAAADAALARLGDATATARLTDEANTATQARGDARAEALPAAGAAAVPALRRLLTDPAGPTRAAALRALGKIEARSAMSDIRRAMNDPDPLARMYAAVALARMGDSQGEEQVTQMLESPVADVRLIAAEAYADRGAGAWVGALLPLLRDPAGLTRLRAAELVARVDPEAARSVLIEAASSANPVVRAEAARVLETPAGAPLSASDLPSLRRLLRDPDPAVRLHAAGIVIELAVGSR